MPTVINIVLPAFATILVGYLFGRFRRININSIVDVTINIGVPALVFVSLIKHDIVLVDAVKICAASPWRAAPIAGGASPTAPPARGRPPKILLNISRRFPVEMIPGANQGSPLIGTIQAF